MDWPEGVRLFSTGNGGLNGTLFMVCASCGKEVALLARDGPRFSTYPELREIMINFARHLKIAALIDRDETQEIIELWPEERVLERGAAWADVLARHRCGTNI